MSVAVCLLLYGAVVCVVAPRLLPYLTRGGSAPVAAVAVWLIVVASVLVSWVAAAAALVVYAARTWHRPDPLALAACLAEVRSAVAGNSGLAMQIGLVAATAVLSAFVVVLASRVGRFLTTARVSSRRHAESARIIGRRVAGIDGLVIDAPQKVAYCVGGRPGTVVITSAAVAALERPHLDAVLAHERAHLAGRHHLLLTATRALATSVPQLRLFTVAHAEVARLLEMCADDCAARRQSQPNPHHRVRRDQHRRDCTRHQAYRTRHRGTATRCPSAPGHLRQRGRRSAGAAGVGISLGCSCMRPIHRLT